MITLDTPIIIYPDTYNGQFFVTFETDIRMGTVTLYLAPAMTDQHNIYVGVKEMVEGSLKVKFPDRIRPVTIVQNLQTPDPAIRLLFQKLTAFLEEAEKIVIANQHEPGGIATSPWQIGTTEWSLQSTYAPTGGRTIGLKPVGDTKE